GEGAGVVLRSRGEVEADDLIEEHLDGRRLAPLTLEEDSNVSIQVARTGHGEIVIDIRLSPDMHFSEASVVELSESGEQALHISSCLYAVPFIHHSTASSPVPL